MEDVGDLSGEPVTGGTVSFSRPLGTWAAPNTVLDVEIGIGAPTTLMPLVNNVFSAKFYFPVWIPPADPSNVIHCQAGSPPCSGNPMVTFYARFGSVKGRVLDRSGVPIGTGVNVSAFAVDSLTTLGFPTWRTVVTDAEGNYDFTLTDADQLLNENRACPGCTGDATVERGNSWGLLLCGDPSWPTDPYCEPQQFPVGHVATRDFYVVAAYGVPGPNDPSRMLVTISSSDLAEKDITIADEEGEPDPSDEECPPLPRPVSVVTGNVFFHHTDADIPAVGLPLTLVRGYNSKNAQAGRYGMFGPGWTHAYERRVTSTVRGGILMRNAKGVARYFGRPGANGIRPATTPVDQRRWIQEQPAGQRTLQLRDGGSETYDSAGRLLKLTDPAGNETILTHEAGTGRLMEVRDARGGRTLRFAYAGNQILLRGPGDKLLATYDLSDGLLASVTYPEGDGYQFGYDAATKELLTVHDLGGKPIERHAYVDGKATLSEIADGRERYSIVYEPFKAIVTDARSNVTTYEWANFGGMKRITKVSGGCPGCGGGAESQEWSYYDDGKVRTVKDGEGNVTTYTYDPDTGGIATETVDPDPSTPQSVETTTNTYWPDGRIKSRQDPRGGLTEWTYVAAGPQTMTQKVSSTESRLTTLSYYGSGDPRQGKVWTITDPRGKVTALDHYPAGDLKSVQDPMGSTTAFQYDALGRRRQVVLPATDPPTSEPTTYHDTRGRVRFIVDPGGTADEAAGTCTKCTAFAYDGGGRLVSRVDPLGHRTTYEHDPYARLEHVKQWVDATTAHTTTYGYDLMSNLEFIRDARSKETGFEYDAFNRVQKVKYPGDTPSDLRHETFSYDRAGQLETRTDRRDVTTTFAYDGLGRLKEKTYSGPGVSATPVTFAYDAADNLETARNGDVSLSWRYDLAGGVTQASDGTSTLAYTYDPAGNRATLSLGETGFALEYHHDDAGRLAWIRRPGQANSQITFGYDDASRRRSLAFPNQVVTEYRPDALSRLDWLAVTRQAATLHHFDYQYNDDSNRTEKKVLGVPEVYAPDPLHRLETATRGGNLVERYGYDPVGNRKSTLAVPNPADWVYSERNELQQAGAAEMQYDRNGNLVRKADASGVWTYDWDVENRLTRATRDGYEATRFGYDPLGRRIEKFAGYRTTRYGYDGEDIVREIFNEGFPEGPQIEYEHHYVHGPGVDEPLAVHHLDGSTWYYHADGLGSIVGATDETGAVVQSRSYDAFGNLETGAQDPGYAFTGREWTPEIGLYYYRARWYDPKLGRFLGEDPIAFDGGINFYTYVRNLPTQLSDPSGLQESPPPPPNIPGGPWTWRPDPMNTRGGTYVGPDSHSASWDVPGDHWDVDNAQGVRQRYDCRGNALTAEQAHAYRGPKQNPIDFRGRHRGPRGIRGIGGGALRVIPWLSLIGLVLDAIEYDEERKYCNENPCECGWWSKCVA